MNKKIIANHAIDVLTEKNRHSIWYGDLEEIGEIANRAGIKGHPLNVNNRVLSALEHDPRFEKGYVKHIGRPARCFTLQGCKKKENSMDEVKTELVERVKERTEIVALLIENEYNITRVAKILGITKQGVLYRMKKLGIKIVKVVEFV